MSDLSGFSRDDLERLYSQEDQRRKQSEQRERDLEAQLAACREREEALIAAGDALANYRHNEARGRGWSGPDFDDLTVAWNRTAHGQAGGSE